MLETRSDCYLVLFSCAPLANPPPPNPPHFRAHLLTDPCAPSQYPRRQYPNTPRRPNCFLTYTWGPFASLECPCKCSDPACASAPYPALAFASPPSPSPFANPFSIVLIFGGVW